MLSAENARISMNLARKPKTHLDKVIEQISKAIKVASRNGAGFVTIETNCLSNESRTYLNNLLKSLGYRFKWHDIGDYDDEKIRIMWEDV